MESYKISIPVYHVGNISQNKKFVKGASVPDSKAIKNWAGDGLYFWDNFGNAKYWLDTNKSGEKRCIVKSCLEIDENYILDLTDYEMVKQFKYWIKLLQMAKVIDSDENMIFRGDKIDSAIAGIEVIQSKLCNIDFLKEYFKDLKIYAVKIMGYYPHVVDTFLFEEDEKSSYNTKNRATIKSKVIYCVKNQVLLKQRTFVKED